MQSTIYFHGGAGSVTGSNFLLESGDTKILIDCGLSQGQHWSDESNWSEFAYDPKTIPFLINTHAHIDHIGRIPLLVKRGFHGRIISTEATRAMAEPLLLDSMELLAHDARKHGREPLYDEKDIHDTMALWEGITYHAPMELAGGFSVELLDAGHILGSAMAKISREGKSILFTGDLGGGNSPLLSPVEEPKDISYMVMESVYGDRMRPDSTTKHHRDQLENVIEDTVARGGSLLIPAFSTERTQDLLFEIRTLMQEKRIPTIPVFVDSPLAEKMTHAFIKYPKYFSDDIRKRVEGGENIFSFPELRLVEDMEESRKIGGTTGSKIIIAGSGMSNGGRVHSHQQHILPDAKSTLLIVGYQAAGSLGRRLVEGSKKVMIMGHEVPVRCKVESIYGYSAHMDGEQLLEFVNKIGNSLKQIFVVMGEPASSGFLVQRIRDYLALNARAPQAGEKAQIDL